MFMMPVPALDREAPPKYNVRTPGAQNPFGDSNPFDAPPPNPFGDEDNSPANPFDAPPPNPFGASSNPFGEASVAAAAAGSVTVTPVGNRATNPLIARELCLFACANGYGGHASLCSRAAAASATRSNNPFGHDNLEVSTPGENILRQSQV